jgi:hypothetical protein
MARTGNNRYGVNSGGAPHSLASWPPSEAAIQGCLLDGWTQALDGRVKPGHDVIGYGR